MSHSNIRDLFERARELPEGERDAFLQTHCQDSNTRDLVNRILVADRASTEQVSIRSAAQWMNDIGAVEIAALLPNGSYFESYRIEALLGEGGSAMVYRATRKIAETEQVVALKVLRQRLADAHARLLFERERDALVRLSHLNIAHLIDGGINADGQAYLALEYVEGLQLLHYVRANTLSFRDRIKLMISVIKAVSAAHRALIVHRDLKPANVLITVDGAVKLLDFGIAKLQHADVGDRQNTQTEFRAFTPAYAAPEQREGRGISTATDVYSLGVILSEVLTGTRCNEDLSHTPSDLISQDATSGVLPASPALTKRWLRRDLDNILLKATANEPELRYETAAAFAEDLERLLAGQPVRAHPPSGWYRLRKFVVRHRGGVMVTGLLVLAVLSSLGLAVWQATLTRREANRAQAVTQFLLSMFQASEDQLPRDQRPTLAQIIGQARLQLDNKTQFETDTPLDLMTRAEIEYTLGEVSRMSANYADADYLLDAALGDFAKADAASAQVIKVKIAQARLLQKRGDNHAALSLLQPVTTETEELDPESMSVAMGVKARAQYTLGDLAGAKATAERRDLWCHKHWRADHVEVLSARIEHATLLQWMDYYSESQALLEPALARWKALKLPMNLTYINGLSAAASNAYGLGEFTDAERMFEQLLQLQRTVLSEPHDQIATALRNYAVMLASAGKTDASIRTHRESIAMLRKVFGDTHEQLVLGHTQLAVNLTQIRQYDLAEVEFLAAQSMCKSFASMSLACIRTQHGIGRLRYHQKRFPEARQMLEQALQQARAQYGEQHLQTAQAYNGLSDVAAKEKRYSEAVEMAQKSVDIIEQLQMRDSESAILARNSLAGNLWLADRNQDALRMIQECIKAYDQLKPQRLPRRVMMRVLQAQILAEMGEPAQARAIANQAIALNAPSEQLSEVTKQLLQQLSQRKDVYPEVKQLN